MEEVRTKATKATQIFASLSLAVLSALVLLPIAFVSQTYAQAGGENGDVSVSRCEITKIKNTPITWSITCLVCPFGGDDCEVCTTYVWSHPSRTECRPYLGVDVP
jgi:hypothetical protein